MDERIGARVQGRVWGPRVCSLFPPMSPYLEKGCASVPTTAPGPYSPAPC